MFNPISFLRSRLSSRSHYSKLNRKQRQLLTISGSTGFILLLWLASLPSRDRVLSIKPARLGQALQSTRHNLSLTRYELELMSLFTRLRGHTPPPDNIVLLAIDDESINIADYLFPEELDETPILKAMSTWPWPRRVHARAVELLMEAGADAVIFDVIFSTGSSYGPRDDRTFANILEQYGDRIVLAGHYPPSTHQQNRIDRVTLPIQDYLNTGIRVGYTNITLSENGVNYVLATEFQPPELPLLASGSLVSLAESGLLASGQSLPDQPGSWVYYYGQPGTITTISYSQLMVPAFREANLNEDTFRDKIVLIGATTPTLQDIHTTPWGEMPGPEIVLTNLANLQAGQWLRTLSVPMRLITLLAVGLGGGWIVTRPNNARYVVLCTLVVTTAWLGLAFSLFLAGWAITVTVWGATAIFLSGTIDAINIAIADRLGRLRLQQTLERYVSAPVANEIISHQQEGLQNLFRGKSLKASLLFSDIRGFTTISSQLPAEQLVPQLNRYLGAMVDAITRHQGCVDKFIGDAVMAEFGSPISSGHQQDSLNAIKAALDMRAALVALREDWTKTGQPLMFNGIGINFGDVVVGNIGSPQRLEYTAIGDAVNVASRVESLTKDFKTDLIITESVYELVKDEIDVNPLGSKQLRGRSTETELFEVIGLRGSDRSLFDRVKADFAAHIAKKEANSAQAANEQPQVPLVPNAGIDVSIDDIQQQADGHHD